MHNLIGYIGSTDDQLASSTALHSDSPTTGTATSESTKTDDQTAKQKEKEGSGSSQEDSEMTEGEGGDGETEGEIIEYKPLPAVLKVEVEKWRSSLNYAIDSQDTQATEKVYIWGQGYSYLCINSCWLVYTSTVLHIVQYYTCTCRYLHFTLRWFSGWWSCCLASPAHR